MFYRTYRPQTIAQLDSPAIRERLTKILEAPIRPHAFIFAGPKGIGKTSIARIMAKAINCENNKFGGKGDSVDPCNKCQFCLAITSGQAVDVIELDGASNRRIDDIRALINSVSLGAVYTHYKVYIIDEVHMLTNESFNALLKTLEDPPANVMFVLATTELDKIPPTIVSRCILIQFNKAEKEDIIHMLSRIKQAENIRVDDEALEYIAEHSEGSFRDATKIFEEASLRKIPITTELIAQIVGIDSGASTLLAHIEKKDIKQIFSFLKDYDQAGKSCKVLVTSFLELIHHMLLSKQAVIEDKIETSLTSKQLMQLLKGFQTAYGDLKNTPIQTLPIEIAVVEYFGKNK